MDVSSLPLWETCHDLDSRLFDVSEWDCQVQQQGNEMCNLELQSQPIIRGYSSHYQASWYDSSPSCLHSDLLLLSEPLEDGTEYPTSLLTKTIGEICKWWARWYKKAKTSSKAAAAAYHRTPTSAPISMNGWNICGACPWSEIRFIMPTKDWPRFLRLHARASQVVNLVDHSWRSSLHDCKSPGTARSWSAISWSCSCKALINS